MGVDLLSLLHTSPLELKDDCRKFVDVSSHKIETVVKIELCLIGWHIYRVEENQMSIEPSQTIPAA